MRRNSRLPPGAETRARRKLWYEENSPGQRRTASLATLPVLSSRMPVLEVRDFGEPQAITVQLDRQIVVTTLTGNYKLVAEITYGVGGASDTFLVDWADGTLITIVAQRLTVVARGEQQSADNPYAIDDGVQELIAAVGKGQPSVIMPTYSRPLPALAPGNTSPIITPPAFAKAVSVLGGPNDPYPFLSMNQFDTFAVTSRQEGTYFAGGAAMPLLPNIRLTLNNAAANPNSIVPTLLFHLAL